MLGYRWNREHEILTRLKPFIFARPSFVRRLASVMMKVDLSSYLDHDQELPASQTALVPQHEHHRQQQD